MTCTIQASKCTLLLLQADEQDIMFEGGLIETYTSSHAVDQDGTHVI